MRPLKRNSRATSAFNADVIVRIGYMYHFKGLFGQDSGERAQESLNRGYTTRGVGQLEILNKTLPRRHQRCDVET